MGGRRRPQGARFYMPVVFAQRGMTTLGKSLNVSQLSADPWEKFLRYCQAGLASCSFFFFSSPQQFKRDNPTEWEKAFGPCPEAPHPEAPLTLGWGRSSELISVGSGSQPSLPQAAPTPPPSRLKHCTHGPGDTQASGAQCIRLEKGLLPRVCRLPIGDSRLGSGA